MTDHNATNNESASADLFEPVRYVLHAASSVLKSGAHALGFVRAERPSSGHASRQRDPLEQDEARGRLPAESFEYLQIALQAEAIRGRSAKIQETCHKATLETTRVIFERKNFTESLDRFQEQLNDVKMKLNLMDASNSLPEDNSISEALDKVMDTSDSLLSRAKGLQIHDTGLVTLHKALGQQAVGIIDAAEALKALVKLSTPEPDDVGLTNGFSASPRSSSSAPSLVTQYMDKKGTLELLRERLYDLHADRAESRDRYDAQAERDDDLLPDQDGEVQYQNTRIELLQELEDTKREMAELEALCASQRIDLTLVTPASSAFPDQRLTHEGYVMVNNKQVNNEQVDLWMQSLQPAYVDSDQFEVSNNGATMGNMDNSHQTIVHDSPYSNELDDNSGTYSQDDSAATFEGSTTITSRGSMPYQPIAPDPVISDPAFHYAPPCQAEQNDSSRATAMSRTEAPDVNSRPS